MKGIKKLLLLMVLAFSLASSTTVNAAEATCSVTDTTATFDCTAYFQSLITEKGWTPISYNVTLSNYLDKTVVITGGTTTGFILYNLTPGTMYYVDIDTSVVDTEGNPYTTQETVFFETTGTYNPPSDMDGEEVNKDNSSSNVTSNDRVPKINKVSISGTTVTASINLNGADGAEYKICRKKGNKTVATGDIISSSVYEYGIKANHVYYIVARTYIYDDNYNKVYSNWSGKKYFVSQPTISTKKSKIKSNYVNLKWSKVTGAKNYTIYGRNRGSKSWKKIATTKKTFYKVTKLKGKRLNCVSKNYEFTIVANAKIGKKTYNSNKKKYIYTYTVYR